MSLIGSPSGTASTSSSALANYFTKLYYLGFISCAGLLGAAYYFEYVMYLDPCPLCVVQRVITFAIGIYCLIAAIGQRWTTLQLMMMLLVVVTGAFGVWVADHHVWIQNLPEDQVPACGPDLAYMMETLPMSELISRMLEGNGSCADVSWSFLSLSMPEWMRIWFAGYTLVGLACFSRIANHLRKK